MPGPDRSSKSEYRAAGELVEESAQEEERRPGSAGVEVNELGEVGPVLDTGGEKDPGFGAVTDVMRGVVRAEKDPGPPVGVFGKRDPWAHRSELMRCKTCMWFVFKDPTADLPRKDNVGRCRRHSPTTNGYPAVFPGDWCGDHKVDENKV